MQTEQQIRQIKDQLIEVEKSTSKNPVLVVLAGMEGMRSIVSDMPPKEEVRNLLERLYKEILEERNKTKVIEL